MVTAAPGACAVCASPASVTEWRPLDDWLAVEGCPCNDFFISKWLWAGGSGACGSWTVRNSARAFRLGGRTDARPGCPPRTVRAGASSSPDIGNRYSETPRGTLPGP
jgi:hypothetical protein